MFRNMNIYGCSHETQTQTQAQQPMAQVMKVTQVKLILDLRLRHLQSHLEI